MSTGDDVLDIDNISPSMRTNRFNRYQSLVATWAEKDGEEGEESDGSDKEVGEDDTSEEEETEHEYPFEDAYELFTAGLVIGYARDDTHEETGSRELYRLASIDGTMYGTCIRMIFYLVAAEDQDDYESETEVWNKLLRYADWGVGWIYRHRDREDGIEFVDILDELDDIWEGRVQTALDTAQDARDDTQAGSLTWRSDSDS